MKFSVIHLAAAAALAASSAAMAQTDRSAIKEETKAANKAGALHGGEGSPMPQGKMESNKTRAERKAETNALAKDGKLNLKGETSGLDGIVDTPKSTANRQAVKSETRAAVKGGQIPSGEK